MILKVFPVGAYAANCYIIGSEKNREGMVIDPGDDARDIIGTITELELKVSVIVLTHGHLDHIAALKQVKEATSADVLVHRQDAALLSDRSFARILGVSSPEPPAPDRLIEDGDEVAFGDESFKVIHTPGHTPGSICLSGGGVLFSGDTLFRGGIGRFDLPGGSCDELMRSLARLMLLPEATVVYPGHGPRTTIGTEKRDNPFLQA